MADQTVVSSCCSSEQQPASSCCRAADAPTRADCACAAESATSTPPPSEAAPAKRRFVGRKRHDKASASPQDHDAGAGDIEAAAGTLVVMDDEASSSASKSGRSKRSTGTGRVYRGKPRASPFAIPDHIMHNLDLNNTIAALLPGNYNFEVHKTLHRIETLGSKVVALQMPEGLQAWACAISDILERFAKVEVIILGDVTYGACCVDDYTARALGADLLVHYGHSCLVPVTVTQMNTLYVFVDIGIDTAHLSETIKFNFAAGARLALVGTIQFASSLQVVAAALRESGYPDLVVPQARPLSPGEILGCTSPQLMSQEAPLEALIYVGDGRFHLESIMIANPTLKAYRYDPYSKEFTVESYDTAKMHCVRQAAIAQAAQAKTVGIIMGTLGRQGSPRILEHLQQLLRERDIAYHTVLLSEIFPAKLDLIEGVDCWVQIACPRLSIDWGYAFAKPLLNPYEAEIAFNQAQTWREVYPMDFYRKDGGPWTVYYQEPATTSAATAAR